MYKITFMDMETDKPTFREFKEQDVILNLRRNILEVSERGGPSLSPRQPATELAIPYIRLLGVERI